MQVHFITNIPYFKVTEHYDTARSTANMRRDLRSGRTSAEARRSAEGITVRSLWAVPNPGGWGQAGRRAHMMLGGGLVYRNLFEGLDWP